jgi:hypothetical protein
MNQKIKPGLDGTAETMLQSFYAGAQCPGLGWIALKIFKKL